MNADGRSTTCGRPLCGQVPLDRPFRAEEVDRVCRRRTERRRVDEARHSGFARDLDQRGDRRRRPPRIDACRGPAHRERAIDALAGARERRAVGEVADQGLPNDVASPFGSLVGRVTTTTFGFDCTTAGDDSAVFKVVTVNAAGSHLTAVPEAAGEIAFG
jgi:hypothetical protein